MQVYKKELLLTDQLTIYGTPSTNQRPATLQLDLPQDSLLFLLKGTGETKQWPAYDNDSHRLNRQEPCPVESSSSLQLAAASISYPGTHDAVGWDW